MSSISTFRVAGESRRSRMNATLANEIRILARNPKPDDVTEWCLKGLSRVALRAFHEDLNFVRDLGMSSSDRTATAASLSALHVHLSGPNPKARHQWFLRRVAGLSDFFDGWLRHAGSNYHLAHWNLKRIRHCQHRMSRLLAKNKTIPAGFRSEETVEALKALALLAEKSPATFYRLRQSLAELLGAAEIPGLAKMRPSKPIARIVTATVPLYRLLRRDLDAIYELSPAAFEDFVGDRLDTMGMDVHRVSSTFAPDGGVDLIATPRSSTFPFLLAVQVKHHRHPSVKTGPGPVKDMQSVLAALPFHAGMIVTNTRFTPDADWWASQCPGKLQLHDIETIRHWIEDRFHEDRFRGIPSSIQLTPGLQVEVW